MTIDKAIMVAAEAHEGQVDKAGVPIILHALRVMLDVDPRLRVAAVLHDVVEDTKFTLDDLRTGGLGPRDAEIVDAMTRREGEKYFDYVRRVSQDRDACDLKLADVNDNMRPDGLTDSLRGRYSKTIDILSEAQDGHRNEDDGDDD